MKNNAIPAENSPWLTMHRPSKRCLIFAIAATGWVKNSKSNSNCNYSNNYNNHSNSYYHNYSENNNIIDNNININNNMNLISAKLEFA